MYFSYFLFAFVLSSGLSILVLYWSRRLGIVDRPKDGTRKIHKKSVPLGGGLAIFLSFFAVAGLALFSDGTLGHLFTKRHFAGLFLGGAILMIGGILDDRYSLRPSRQMIFPLLAAGAMIAAGIAPTVVTNPFGGVVTLREVVSLGAIETFLTIGDIMLFLWLSVMMFATKLLDGLDGLVAGMVLIGSVMIYFLSRQPEWYQPEVAALSMIFAGACAGFLLWNFHPARLFLGQGGSLFTGFVLGSLAVISGGKIATTLLVMGIPILDMVRVVARRIARGRPIFSGDREHVHYQLLASGLSHRQAVLLLYAISLLFGLTTLFLQSRQKLFALLLLCILMLLLGVRFSHRQA